MGSAKRCPRAVPRPETRERLADHREPEQWTFFVLRTETLPAAQRSISLARVERLARTVRAEQRMDPEHSSASFLRTAANVLFPFRLRDENSFFAALTCSAYEHFSSTTF